MKQKSLLLITEYWPPDEGGMAIYAYEVFTRLASLGWQIRVLCPKTRYPRWITKQSNLEFNFFLSPKIHAFGRTTIFPILFKELLIKKHDVIVDLSVAPYAGASAFINHFFQLPHAIIAHGNEVSRIYPDQGMTRTFRRYCLYGYQKASVIVANSQFTASLFGPLSINPEKIQVIYCGVNINLFKMVNRDVVYQNEKRKLLLVGQLKPTKGHRLLIQALPAILRHYPNLSVDIIGTGPSENELKKLVQTLGLDAYVKFHGQLPQTELVKFYQEAYLLVLPTLQVPQHFEGFGLVAAEALACGCPVTASKVGGHTEFVKDNETGRLFDPNHPEEIVKTIVECLHQPDTMKKFGIRGKELIHQNFTWDKSALDWNKLLNQLIQK
ncbi:MAG: glycosyltransferase family 4 protein [bacterium]|nr:glycosyltransferase family 4 protein [bacterium]